METNILYGFLCGIVTAIAVIKGIDWMISTKYVSKKECEECRKEIYDRSNGDRDLLTQIDTKVDMLMENFDLKQKEK